MTRKRVQVGDVRSALLAAAACAVILSAAGCSISHSDRPVDPETGVLNFAKVSDSLWRGGQPSAESFTKLKAMGVRTVVSLRTFNTDRRLLKGHGLKYLHISFKTWHPETEDILEFLKTVEDPANQPVFVHCKWGTDRSGMMTAVYRIVVEGWAKEQALEEMHAMGFNEAWDSISDYVERLDAAAIKERLRDAPAPPLEVVP
ncbi:MAG: protein tyrosine phosphatase family protein [Phycisphaerae bacterium]|nr:protein tyrosine phosphatase family protein [Phycisphaerae bacterium]